VGGLSERFRQKYSDCAFRERRVRKKNKIGIEKCFDMVIKFLLRKD
jgi:hypothetical protein